MRADAVCNVVLDADRDFDYLSGSLGDILAMRPHFLVYSDGGCRKTGVSAIG